MNNTEQQTTLDLALVQVPKKTEAVPPFSANPPVKPQEA